MPTVVAAFHSHKSVFRFGIVACLLTPMGVQRVADVPSEGARPALGSPGLEGKSPSGSLAFILKNWPSNSARRTLPQDSHPEHERNEKCRPASLQIYAFRAATAESEAPSQPTAQVMPARDTVCVSSGHVVWPSPSSFASVFPPRTTKFAPLGAAKPQPASSRRCFLPSGNVGITLADALMMTIVL
uniref:Transmembrane protein n=1 Tax=Panagrellus redivivus TaxID=6233 RepID=A0A7E4ZXX0_PANRE